MFFPYFSTWVWVSLHLSQVLLLREYRPENDCHLKSITANENLFMLRQQLLQSVRGFWGRFPVIFQAIIYNSRVCELLNFKVVFVMRIICKRLLRGELFFSKRRRKCKQQRKKAGYSVYYQREWRKLPGAVPDHLEYLCCNSWLHAIFNLVFSAHTE